MIILDSINQYYIRRSILMKLGMDLFFVSMRINKFYI